MRYFVLLVIQFYSLALVARCVSVLPLPVGDGKWDSSKGVFPMVRVAGSPEVEKNINLNLQTDFAEVFDLIKAQREGLAYEGPDLDDFEYELVCNKGRLLSIAISWEGCGAYCESSAEYYTYDVHSGKRIGLDTLLSPTGRKILSDSVSTRVHSMISQKLDWLNDTLRAIKHLAGEEEVTYYRDMKALYEVCMERDIDLSFYKYYLCQEWLFIEVERCSAHFNRDIDELYNFEMRFPVAYWQKYFSPYGLQLIRK